MYSRTGAPLKMLSQLRIHLRSSFFSTTWRPPSGLKIPKMKSMALIWPIIYEHRPLNRMNRKKSVTAKFSNAQLQDETSSRCLTSNSYRGMSNRWTKWSRNSVSRITGSRFRTSSNFITNSRTCSSFGNYLLKNYQTTQAWKTKLYYTIELKT